VIGGHLDSWDPGTGAIDDAAGIAITMAAARLVAATPHRRTIRMVIVGLGGNRRVRRRLSHGPQERTWQHRRRRRKRRGRR